MKLPVKKHSESQMAEKCSSLAGLCGLIPAKLIQELRMKIKQTTGESEGAEPV